ncbi:biopolymer transporter ExbD [Bdellovibrionota bacterium FG-2]
MAGQLDTSEDSTGEGMTAISAINVTPFVDVMLVLLVIFIVTTPMLMKDVLSVKLPTSTTADMKSVQSIGIAITQQGQLLLNGAITTPESLSSEVRASVAKDPQVKVIIAADTESRHGDVVRVIDLVKTAGATQFAIQIQRP